MLAYKCTVHAVQCNVAANVNKLIGVIFPSSVVLVNMYVQLTSSFEISPSPSFAEKCKSNEKPSPSPSFIMHSLRCYFCCYIHHSYCIHLDAIFVINGSFIMHSLGCYLCHCIPSFIMYSLGCYFCYQWIIIFAWR